MGGLAGAPPSATRPCTATAASAAFCIFLRWTLPIFTFLAAGGGKGLGEGTGGGGGDKACDEEEFGGSGSDEEEGSGQLGFAGDGVE